MWPVTEVTRLERRALVALLSVAVSISVGAAPESAGANPRLRMFPGTTAVPVAFDREPGAALRVLFTPQSWACTVSDDVAARVVQRFADAYDDVAAWSLVPLRREGVRTRPIPTAGREVAVPLAAILTEAELAPLPRIEVWTRDGRLLLLRSLGSFQDDELYDELVWTRSFLDDAPVSD